LSYADRLHSQKGPFVSVRCGLQAQWGLAMQWATSGKGAKAIQSRVSWFIRDSIKGRRTEVARATGMSRSTIDRYCDFQEDRAEGEAGSAKVEQLWAIIEALGHDPVSVFAAGLMAATPEEMRFLVTRPLYFDLSGTHLGLSAMVRG